MPLGKAANGRLKVTTWMDFDFEASMRNVCGPPTGSTCRKPQAVAAIITKAARGVALATQ